jgi:hypothetical protein
MPDASNAEQPTCFVAMPVTTPTIYVERLRDGGHFAHVLEHLFTPALIKAGYRVIDPTSRGAQLIHAEIIRNLEQSDLVLCDLSSLNANVFFELGIRTSLDRPVVLVKDGVTERIPFDLNAINTHTYDESLTPWTLASEIERLSEHIKAVEAGSGSGNDMWRYFGLTKRATPSEISGNPTEGKLDLVLAEITALRDQPHLRRDISVFPESGIPIGPGRHRQIERAVEIAARAVIGKDCTYEAFEMGDSRIRIRFDAPLNNDELDRIQGLINGALDATVSVLVYP